MVNRIRRNREMDDPATTLEIARLNSEAYLQMVRYIVAGATMAIGSVGPAIAEGKALAQALESIARQPDASGTVSRTLFVGLAMVESTAIYCLVMAFIILFVK
jgi:F-type H+-transporting ATPase subunit c